jgi:hypothetical protein
MVVVRSRAESHSPPSKLGGVFVGPWGVISLSFKTRATKRRPWQFSLRSLLLLTTVVAAGAAFFGWRARQLEPQRRAVARIVDLGGSVEIGRRGWIEALWHGHDTEEVVHVTLPGHLSAETIPELKTLRSLMRVTMAYSLAGFVGYDQHGGVIITRKAFVTADGFISPSDERARFDRLKEALPSVMVDVIHDGVPVPLDAAFVDVTSRLLR